MTTIHTEPDVIRERARLLDSAAGDLLEAKTNLQSAAVSLEMAWQGGSSEKTVSELQTISTSLQTRIDDLRSYILLLFHQADLWDEMDQKWQSLYQERFR